ncbi:23S rRNA (guanosine(2251)-2'-O)-methyltransferase RlmB [Corynebacterium sp. A21]|uniref:23S rRNA (guanosine(2251)-2'-O)-methyltransferase RlmB n=1 Tax=Corynebacterium sp. A21 TaxID=3457318 RepID=UPI003FD0FF6E
MAGNDKRRGALRTSTKKGATKGSGGQARRSLEGKGPTPKAEDRPYHAAHKRRKVQERRSTGRHDRNAEQNEMVVGRNPVLECLRARVPSATLHVVEGTTKDDRLSEAIQLAASRNIPLVEVSRFDMDRMTGNGMHQGIGLVIPPFQYSTVHDLIVDINGRNEPGLVVILDNITDPRNLGAVIRSVAGFGGHGVVIPERRSASVTAVAWRTSAGTAARLPVAKATNLTRTIKEFQQNGYQVIGLDGDGDVTLDSYKGGTEPVVIVLGSEGKGISRLVKENCDYVLSIPTTDWVESLNASVAASVVLSEFARQRRLQG